MWICNHWLTAEQYYYSFNTVMFFLLLLTIGYIYEWEKGALDWE